MKLRYRIPPSTVEKYKDDFFFRVETVNTFMEAVIHRVKSVEPKGYKMREKLIEGYAKIILKSKEDKNTPRWGTCVEKIKEVESKLYNKEIKNNFFIEMLHPLKKHQKLCDNS